MNKFNLIFYNIKTFLLDNSIPSLRYFSDVQVINRLRNSNISFEYWIRSMQAGEQIISYKFKNLFRELEHSIKLKQSIYIAKRIFESYIFGYSRTKHAL